MFKYYVMPQRMTLREDGDNSSDEEEANVRSFDECRAACEAKTFCRQYSYDQNGHCRSRVNHKLGAATKELVSGLVEDRVTPFEQDMAPCGVEESILVLGGR